MTMANLGNIKMDRRVNNIYRLLKSSAALLLLVAAALLLKPASAFAWPTDSQWIPLLKGGAVLQDDEGDANGERNVVPNDGSSPAAYLFNDGTYLNYRIRLDDDPSGTGGQGLLRPYGWGFEIDIDQNPDDYEWLVMCDGISSPEVITLGENTDKTGIGDPSDRAENIVASYPLSGNYRIIQAPTNTNGDPDYFLDFRLPYDVFKAQTGITDNTLIRYFIGTSNQATTLSADLVNGSTPNASSTLYNMASDYTTPLGIIPPSMIFYDSTVRFVDNIDGFNDKEVAAAGDTVYIRVDDLDQTSDVNPAQTIRVSLVSAGTGDTETVILNGTGVSSKFTGSIPSATGGASSQDGILQVLADDTVTVTYVDAIAADRSQSVDRTDTLLIVSTGTDLSLTKTVDNPIPSEGDTIVYTLTLTNHGPAATSGFIPIFVADALPPGVTFVGPATGDGSYGSGAGPWVIFGSLTVGASFTIDIPATVDAGTSGQTIDNTANITFSWPTDQYAGNNSDTASIDVGGTDFRVTKDVSDPGPSTGDNITYSVRVFNIGSNNGSNVVVTDLLPVGEVAYISDNPSQGTYNSGTGAWSVGSLNIGSGALLEITANVTAAAGSTVTNTASFTSADQPDTNAANDSASVDIQVGFVDLAITKTVDTPAPLEGDNIVYTLIATNNGPSDATGVTITDNLPVGVTYVSDDGSGAYSGGIWTIGNLNNGSSATLNITASVDGGTAGQTIANIASVSTVNEPDSDSSNDTDSASISVNGADISITKTVDNPVPGELDIINYTLTVTNNGPNDATGIVVHDLLPGDRDAGIDGVTYDNYHLASQGSYSITGGGRTYDWTVGDIAFGDSATLTIRVEVENNTAGLTVTNVAYITGVDQVDYNSANDVGSVDIAIEGTDLAITKTVDDPTPDIGDQVVYTIIVSNNGPIDATNVAVTDQLPPELNYITDDGGGSYNSGTGIWTIGTILNGGTATLNITALVQNDDEHLVITNTATITAMDQGDPVPANNTDFADINVSGTDLAITKVVDDTAPMEGATITYTITVTNNGANDATNVEVEDILPAGITYVSDTPSQGSYSAGLWLVGTITAPAGSATLDIVATVNPFTVGSTITNTATITALDQIDSDPVNDSASVDIVPVALPLLSILKSADTANANPGDIITYTLTILNSGAGVGANVIAHDHMSGYTQWQLDFGAGTPFEWTPGTSGLTFNLVADVEYSDNNGATWTATPLSGQGGAPAGYDATITNWRINMQGDMAVTGSFTLRYRVRVE